MEYHGADDELSTLPLFPTKGGDLAGVAAGRYAVGAAAVSAARLGSGAPGAETQGGDAAVAVGRVQGGVSMLIEN